MGVDDMSKANILFEKTDFGYVIINGRRYDHDVIVISDGTIMRRRKELSKEYRRLYGHTPFSRKEAEFILRFNPEIVVIATGQYGDLPLMDDALRLLRDKGVELMVGKTPEMLSKLNGLFSSNRKVVAVIHVTC